MADLLPSKSVSISSLLSNIELYKYNPATIQSVIFDYLDEVTGGTVDIVDPTNPFVFLLEASSINTAACINEAVVNLRKQYACLSQLEEELYPHMCGKDFLNRFSVPAETEFTFVIQVNDLLNKMVYDAAESCYKATIPRDTEITVDDLTFTMEYPIDIRKFDNGVVQISYDATITSPLRTLSSNIIDYIVRRDTSQVDWLYFKISLSQYNVEPSYFPLQKSISFSEDIPFSDKYFYVRVYYRNNATNSIWTEMLTTHTQQVFDPFTPTAILKAYESKLNISIPIIYMTSGLISGELRVDIFTTKGKMTVNLSNYKLDSFGVNLRALDETRDLNDYTAVFLTLSHYVYSDQTISGGTNGIDFETLRERVIFNSTGDQQLPITNVELEAKVNNSGFDLIKNIDVITNRVFLAAQKLPAPTNTKLLTPANIGISTFTSSIEYLSTLSTTAKNNDRLTILSKNVFLDTNGVVQILTANDLAALQTIGRTAMVEKINSSQYLYNPFYYVLDNSSSEFEVRIYDLDYPEATGLSFISQNQSLQLPVNTTGYNLAKIKTGYRLTIKTKSGNFYKQLPDAEVTAQLAFCPVGETDLAYINGVLLGKTDEGERIYTFDIVSNHDINSSHRLCITNSKMFNSEDIDVWVELATKFHIFYCTSSITNSFTPSEADGLIGKFLLPANTAVSTHETLDLRFGYSLKNLWSRSRSLATGLEYATYKEDIPLYYEVTVYKTDPVTGSIFSIDADGELVYNILHLKGDPVLDSDGLPVYQHRKNDVKLDGDGKPTIITDLSVNKELDILFVDGKYYFADDAAFVSYADEISNVLSTWVVDNIQDIQDVLLEQTKIFFYPKTTLGKVKITASDGLEDYIPAEQSFTVDLCVKEAVYLNEAIREQLKSATIELLDKYISETVVNITVITAALKELYGDAVVAFKLYGLGGSKDYQIASLASEHNRLCLKKILQIQQDNKLIIKEDVTVNFQKVE